MLVQKGLNFIIRKCAKHGTDAFRRVFTIYSGFNGIAWVQLFKVIFGSQGNVLLIRGCAF